MIRGRLASARAWLRKNIFPGGCTPALSEVLAAIELVPQPQRLRGQDHDRGGRLAAPGEDVEDHAGGMDVLAGRLGAGGVHGRQAVAQHGGEDVDHLQIVTDGAGELAAQPTSATIVGSEASTRWITAGPPQAVWRCCEAARIPAVGESAPV
jgi:hypothetical protein